MPGSNSEWIERIPEILRELRSLDLRKLDRAAIELIFGISRAGAKRLMNDFGAAGRPLLVERSVVIEKLQEQDSELTGQEEVERRRRFAQWFVAAKRDRVLTPTLLVEAPDAIINTRVRDLSPNGVNLEPGRITIEFQTPEEATKKLLLLGMAMGREYSEFEALTLLDDQGEDHQERDEGGVGGETVLVSPPTSAASEQQPQSASSDPIEVSVYA